MRLDNGLCFKYELTDHEISRGYLDLENKKVESLFMQKIRGEWRLDTKVREVYSADSILDVLHNLKDGGELQTVEELLRYNRQINLEEGHAHITHVIGNTKTFQSIEGLLDNQSKPCLISGIEFVFGEDTKDGEIFVGYNGNCIADKSIFHMFDKLWYTKEGVETDWRKIIVPLKQD